MTLHRLGITFVKPVLCTGSRACNSRWDVSSTSALKAQPWLGGDWSHGHDPFLSTGGDLRWDRSSLWRLMTGTTGLAYGCLLENICSPFQWHQNVAQLKTKRRVRRSWNQVEGADPCNAEYSVCNTKMMHNLKGKEAVGVCRAVYMPHQLPKCQSLIICTACVYEEKLLLEMCLYPSFVAATMLMDSSIHAHHVQLHQSYPISTETISLWTVTV